MEERRNSGGTSKRRKPIRAPDESVIKKSTKTEQDRADEAAKFSGRPLKPGEGAHFDRNQYKRKDTGAPQPWDAAQQASSKAKEYKVSTEELAETEKKPKAKTGCLGMLLLALGSPVVSLIVFAQFWRLR
jgi:hypothetical protein